MKDGKRNYDKELRWEKEDKPMRVKHRAQRNAARAMLMEEGRVRKGDDVDHKKPISLGGGNERSNLRVRSKAANRSVARKSDGSLKR
jgi:5-methylcytosine-specific restriction endonuclease McrA